MLDLPKPLTEFNSSCSLYLYSIFSLHHKTSLITMVKIWEYVQQKDQKVEKYLMRRKGWIMSKAQIGKTNFSKIHNLFRCNCQTHVRPTKMIHQFLKDHKILISIFLLMLNISWTLQIFFYENYETNFWYWNFFAKLLFLKCFIF